MNNQWMEQRITNFVKDYQFTHKTETCWQQPIVGFADANDPLFYELKNIISQDHALPGELVPNAQSVIAFFIPFDKAIAEGNAKGNVISRAWDQAYVDTNALIASLSEYLHDVITENGGKASLLPPTYNFDSKKLLSGWSHRSAAYIAGIGTFGLNHMLITAKGCCGRIGSVITDLHFDPTPRPDSEYCLYFKKGICHRCADKCVANAYAPNTFILDRHQCYNQLYKNGGIHEANIGLGDTCGKCMCGLPCSATIP